MSKRHSEKDEAPEFDEEVEFGVDGLTYDISLDDMFSDCEDDEEDEPWNRRSRDQARARLKQLRDVPVGHDGDGDDWEDDGW